MIIIPMAGLSSRFSQAGYQVPKFMLEAHGKTLFNHSVGSFKQLFDKEPFLFIALNMAGVSEFIEKEVQLLGLKNYRVVILEKPTLGQAHTVYLGLKQVNIDECTPITIFNIDTIRPDFVYPTEIDMCVTDGYLETFIGEGANWSNVLPDVIINNKVSRTAEKESISEYCCTGLYYFRKAFLFMNAFENMQSMKVKNELYIAPLYNYLIHKEHDIRFSVIDKTDVVFSGIPTEYEEFKNKIEL